jgi:hypothetical protein
MSARSNLVINDRAATPVAHTFSPDGSDANGVHVFTEKTGVPAGNPRFTAALRRSNSSGGKVKATLKLAIPVVQTQVVNGISNPVVVRTAYVEVLATFDALSTEQERKDAIGLMANALAPTQVQINSLLTVPEDIW